MTAGEKTFIEFCQTNSLKYENVPVNNINRTPDYKLYLDNDNYVIVEVKDLKENPEETIAINNLKNNKWAVWGNSKIGSKIKNKIDNGKEQLKQFAEESVPKILLLFDNRNPHVSIITNYEISVAMYGIQALKKNDNNRTLSKHSSGKKMTPKEKIYISYIGILENENSLILYENYYASHKIKMNHLDNMHCFKLFAASNDPRDNFIKWNRVL